MKTKQDCYDLSLIICCYNEEAILEENFRRIVLYLDQLKLRYEIIFVDDCSQDLTRQIIEKLVKEYSDRSIKVLFHEQNKGRGGSVKDGLMAAEGVVSGFIDIDLEVSEWYILPCVQAILNEEVDLVTGLRIYKFHSNPYILSRHILSYVYRRVIRFFLKTKLKDTETGYKFFLRKKILPVLEKTQNNHWFWDTEIMLLAEYNDWKIREIPVLFTRNLRKTSTVRVFHDSLAYLKDVWKFKKANRQYTN